MNPHKLIAIIMAPLLGIAGFILAGYYLQEDDAKNPKHYLTAQTPCQFASACLLTTDDIAIQLTMDHTGQEHNDLHISVESDTPLEDVTLSINDGSWESDPVTLSGTEMNKHWEITGVWPPQLNTESTLNLRLAVFINKALYFAEFQVLRS